jgi:hypothetical protein
LCQLKHKTSNSIYSKNEEAADARASTKAVADANFNSRRSFVKANKKYNTLVIGQNSLQEVI